MRRFHFLGLCVLVLLCVSSAFAIQYITPSNGADQSIGSSNLLYLNNANGKIGINTTTPTAVLTVVGNQTTSGNAYFATAGGAVGVNNTNPTYTIDTTGTMRSAYSTYVATSGGGLGVGTTDASSGKISVAYTGTGYSILINRGSLSDGGGFGFRTGGNDRWLFGLRSIGDDDFHIYNYGAARDTLTILNTTGLIGINTTAPSAPLDVNGNATVAGKLYVGSQICLGGTCASSFGSGNATTDTGSAYFVPYWSSTTNLARSVLELNTTGLIYNQTQFVINGTSGKIGINNSRPNATLDIRGSVAIAGANGPQLTLSQGYGNNLQVSMRSDGGASVTLTNSSTAGIGNFSINIQNSAFSPGWTTWNGTNITLPLSPTAGLGTGAHVALGDLNGDGLTDAIVAEAPSGTYECRVYGYTNRGNSTTPSWVRNSSWEVNITYTSPTYAQIHWISDCVPALGDLNQDGVTDLMVSVVADDQTTIDSISYYSDEEIIAYRNAGSTSSVSWSRQSSWDVTTSLQYGIGGHVGYAYTPKITLADLNNDGNPDLVFGYNNGANYASLVSYANTGNGTVPGWTANQITMPTAVFNSGSPVFSDVDSDGDKDLFVANSSNTILAYENAGSAAAPAWTRKAAWDANTSNSPNIGGGDLNGDGRVEFFGATTSTTTVVYKNTGVSSYTPLSIKRTAFNPAWIGWNGTNVTLPSSFTYSHPYFADLNGDGLKDLLIGATSGYVCHIYGYTNRGNSSYPSWTRNSSWELNISYTSSYLANIAYADECAPAVADLNQDNVQDLLVSVQSDDQWTFDGINIYFDQEIIAYKNAGSTSSVSWSRQSSWDVGTSLGKGSCRDGCLNLYYYLPKMTLTDLNNDGNPDIIYGQDGTSYQALSSYVNSGNGTQPSWTSGGINNLPGGLLTPSPVFFDADVDGDKDLFVNNGSANIYAYENTGTVAAPVFTRKSTWDAASSSISGLAVTDLSGDGNMEMLVTLSSSQSTKVLKNIGVASTSTLLTIDTAGQVGVGTTVPSYTFDTAGTIRSTGSAYIATTSGGLGVGTTSPSYTLDVAGNIRSTGSSYFATGSASYAVGIGTTSPSYTLDVSGTLRTTGAKTGFLSDIAEVTEESIEKGDLVSLSFEDVTVLMRGGNIPIFKVRKSSGAEDTDIIGVIFEKLAQDDNYTASDGTVIHKGDRVQVATHNSITFLKASAENGPIVAGDYLMPARTPGYAMKADDTATLYIGRALGKLSNGTGLVNAFIQVTPSKPFTNINNERLESAKSIPAAVTALGIKRSPISESERSRERIGAAANTPPTDTMQKKGGDVVMQLGGQSDDFIVNLG